MVRVGDDDALSHFYDAIRLTFQRLLLWLATGLMIVIIEIIGGAHNGIQLIQTIATGNLKPWQLANQTLGGLGVLFWNVPNDWEIYFVHRYLRHKRGQRCCDSYG
jgi:hypothetical protein